MSLNEVKIAPQGIDEITKKIKALNDSFGMSSRETSDINGGGAFVCEITQLSEAILDFQSSLENLLKGTAVFFDNTRESYANTDQEISVGYLN